MIKGTLAEALARVVTEKASELNLPDAQAALQSLNIERPRQNEHGDYAVNISPLARHARMAPPMIAELLSSGFQNGAWSASVIGGFINFRVSERRLLDSLTSLVKSDAPGRNDYCTGLYCLLEFVSANPTGPLHIGHGRWVALGDSLARILKHCGGHVTTEFYINDAGSQIFNIANSLWYRCLEILDTGGRMPEPVEGQPYPFYSAEYVIDLAQAFILEHQEQILAWDNPSHEAPVEAIRSLGEYAREKMLFQQQELMERCRLTFDTWFSERQLHQQGLVQNTLDTLKASGMTYEQDGAVWFASSRFGDDQDRVLVKSDGSYTYLTADIAYHDDKFRRQGGQYNRFINIWGADHHGYIPRMKAAIQALGFDPDRLEIILGQLVNLLVEGERTRMGKRKKMLTLSELVDEVDVDAVRFWMVSKSQDTALDFDVDLAASSSDENPVFYVQYAHARCASILRNAFATRLDTVNREELPPLMTETDWNAFLETVSADNLTELFSGLETDQARTELRELILKLDSFEDRLMDAARTRSPHIIARYALDLAADFHRFYNVCRILIPDAGRARQRLLIIYALKRVLAQALALLGVSAPEQM